jgi:hypothetical protein
MDLKDGQRRGHARAEEWMDFERGKPTAEALTPSGGWCLYPVPSLTQARGRNHQASTTPPVIQTGPVHVRASHVQLQGHAWGTTSAEGRYHSACAIEAVPHPICQPGIGGEDEEDHLSALREETNAVLEQDGSASVGQPVVSDVY